MSKYGLTIDDNQVSMQVWFDQQVAWVWNTAKSLKSIKTATRDPSKLKSSWKPGKPIEIRIGGIVGAFFAFASTYKPSYLSIY